MTAPPTPKPTRKAEALDRESPTITSRREEDAALKKWPKSRLHCANGILETIANDGNTVAKVPDPRTNPKANEVLTSPKPHTHVSHPETPSPINPVFILKVLHRFPYVFLQPQTGVLGGQ
jgi:hypothetical protein